MKTCLLLVVVLLATSSLAFANSIGLYADTEGIYCWIYDTGTTVLSFYAVAIVPSGTLGVEFSAPQPACMVGATYVGDAKVFSTTIGNSQNDVAVGLGGTCYKTAVHVLTINYLVSGQSTTCCEYPVLAGANDPFGPSSEDCTDLLLHPVSAGIITVNPDANCLCIVPTEDSTWGGIKALYH